MALAKGLAQINPHVRRYLEDDVEDRKVEAEQWAQGKIAGLTNDEAKKLVADGSMPEFADPWKRAALTKYTGILAASAAANEATRIYSTDFDRVNGDVDAMLKGVYTAATKGFEGDKVFMAGFGSSWLSSVAKLRGQQVVDKSKDFQTDKIEKVMGVFRVDIDNAVAAGDLSRLSGIINSRYAANHSVLSMNKRDQDDIVWTLAQQYATNGRKDVVEALLNHKGADGTMLRDRAKFAAHAEGLLNKADDVAHKNGREGAIDERVAWLTKSDRGELDHDAFKAWLSKPENKNKFKPSDIEQMLRNDAAHKLTNANKEAAKSAALDLDRTIQAQEDRALEYGMRAGEMGTLSAVDRVPFFTKEDVKYGRSEPSGGWSAAEFRTKVIDKYLATSQAQFAADVKSVGEAEATKRQWNRELAWFTNNGVNHPKWEQVLGAGAQAASLPTIAGQAPSPVAQAGADLYVRLWAQAPNMAAGMLKDRKAMQFYEAYRLAREGSGDPKHALLMALNYTADPTQFDKPEYRAKLNDVKTAADRIDPTGWFGTAPKNKAWLASMVNERAQFYAHWTSVDEAVKNAADHVKRNIAVINGYAIPKPQGVDGKQVPPGFEKLIEVRLEAFTKEHGKKYGFDKDDLMVIPTDNGFGAWKIVMAGTPFDPLSYGEKSTTAPIFTAKDLWDDYKLTQSAADSKARFEAIHGQDQGALYGRLKKASEVKQPTIGTQLRPDLQRKLDEANKAFMDWVMGRSQDTSFKRNDQYPQQPPYVK
ncbi:hypothetical protein [Reyranella sp. CPCC 100927]|uniref:hypothetical protein n=1 Tax=Reyranella sp. CPCC 100927 TaxID=2599616 RepID=UPI0011B39E0A|nr:hypothetical protein [Reyranella sp. CPCC 100927]TWT10628.1 hypothetical protein FQU96_16040 [Reyranella sp. CPCC 100927]